MNKNNTSNLSAVLEPRHFLMASVTTMKTLALVAAFIFLFSPLAEAAEIRCEIQGDTMHWIADYCMYKVGTDDFASPEVVHCFSTENPKNPDCCANRKKFKMKICELMRSYFDGSTEKCMADKTFSGPTVRDGGI